jgi:L-ascorbate metabolism protein UlaG (beta-lactamase superfamily)
MKITKYEHACLDVTEGLSRLIVCPGIFSNSLRDFSDISAVVITHIHADHLDPKKIQHIIEKNPGVKIFTTEEASREITSNVNIAKAGQAIKVGDFTLEFFGENHAEIDPETPLAQNIGVLINNKLYYPGDSFTECSKPFEILAVPASAPWLRTAQVIPIIQNSNCKKVFPTHNALLSETGNAVTNPWLEKFSERSGKEFVFLLPGDSIEV